MVVDIKDKYLDMFFMVDGIGKSVISFDVNEYCECELLEEDDSISGEFWGVDVVKEEKVLELDYYEIKPIPMDIIKKELNLKDDWKGVIKLVNCTLVLCLDFSNFEEEIVGKIIDGNLVLE